MFDPREVTGLVAILTLLEAPVPGIAEGDTFTIRAGCDKVGMAVSAGTK